MARQQPLHISEECLVTGDAMICELVPERRVVQLRFDRRRLEERLDLGSEEQITGRVMDVVERFDAKAVPRDEERVVLLIPDGEREHPAEFVDTIPAVLLE